MNGEPHAHKVVVHRHYRAINSGPIEVTYGDTTVSTLRWWGRMAMPTNHPSEKRLRKTIEKAIRKHDEGSRVASDSKAYLDEILADYNMPTDKWGSDVLKERT